MTNPPPPLPLPQFPPHKSCTLCPLSSIATSVGIPLHILPESLPPSPTTPAILIVGQNPGHTEDRTGRPFIGPTGRLLRSVYIPGAYLHTLATIYVANTARCYHRDGEGPSAAHYKACRPYLLSDLLALSTLHPSHPLLILTLGAPATTHTYALLGRTKVTLTSSFKHQLSKFPLPSPSSGPQETRAHASSPRARQRPSMASRRTLAAHGEGELPDPVPQSPLPSSQLESQIPLLPSQETKGLKDLRGQGVRERIDPDIRIAPTEREGGLGCLVVSTFHPAAVLRTRNLIYSVEGHLRIALDYLTGRSPIPTAPTLSPFRYPLP